MSDEDTRTLGSCPFCWREPCACDHPPMNATEVRERLKEVHRDETNFADSLVAAALAQLHGWAEPGEIIEEK